MRKLLYIISFILLCLIINILLHNLLPGYRDFLKGVKNGESVEQEIVVQEDIYIEEEDDESYNSGDSSVINVSMNDVVNNDVKNYYKDTNKPKEVEVFNDDVEVSENVKDEEVNEVVSSPKQTETLTEITKDTSVTTVKVEYSSSYDDTNVEDVEESVLNKFSEFNLKQLDLHPRLFDLTTEYPDTYIEYYSEYVTLYFFGDKPYTEIRDVFNILTYELPFSLNEVNNFGNKSFYINLDENFQDSIVRIVLEYKGRTFGFKIKKEAYDQIKEKLNNLN